MTTPAREKRRITLEAAAEEFSVKKDRLIAAVRSGQLDAIKPFREWLVIPQDVEDYLQDQHAKRSA